MSVVPGSAQDITSAATSVIHLNENSQSSPKLIEVEVGGSDKFVVDNAGGVTATSFRAGFASTVLADGSLSTSGDLAIDANSGNGEFTIDAMNIGIDGNGDISPVGLVDGVDLSGHDHGGGSGSQIDHGGLSGNADDDHTQYLERDGSDMMSGNFDVGGNSINNVDTVDGVDVSAQIPAGSGVHGVTGSVVGNSDSQTLTNKTLTTPTIGDFSGATHGHTNNASGGSLSDYVQIVPGSAQTVSTAGTTLVHLNETSGNTPNLMELEVGGTNQFVVDNQGNVMATSFIAGNATTVLADGSLTSGGNFAVDANSGSNGFTVNAMNIAVDGNGDISPVGLVDSIDVDQHFHGSTSTESFVVEGTVDDGYAGPGIQFENAIEEHFMICTSAGTVKKMKVRAEGGSFGEGDFVSVTVNKMGGNTPMAVSVSSAPTVFTSTSSFSVDAGDRISIQFSKSNFGIFVNDISVTLEFQFESGPAENIVSQ